MTLFETYKAIESIAVQLPNINSVVDDFDKLNVGTAKYSAIVIQEDIHSRTEDFMTYNFILGYVDRMVSERDDEVAIHSKAILLLNTIIDTLKKSNQFADVTSTNYNIFTKRFDAMCAGAYCSLSISIPISNCSELASFDELIKRFDENGVYKFRAHGAPWDKATIYVDVQPEIDLQIKSITVDANGQYTVEADPEKTGLERAIVNVSVPSEKKPEETVSKTYTTNGTKTITPTPGSVITEATVNVDVHPANRLTKTYNSNGVKHETGEWKDAEITIDIAEEKPEETLEQRITSNGTKIFNPAAGYVFDKAVVITDVHPVEKLTYNIITNGTKTITGEWKDAEITVDVDTSKPEDTLTRTISSNGTVTFTPSEGHVFDSAIITTDVHPTESLNKTYTSNGQKVETGEWKNASINIDVHPTDSLSARYTTNGTKTITGEFKDGTIEVNVDPRRPEETFSYTYVSNGVYSIKPSEGSVLSEGSVTVAVPSDIHNQNKNITITQNETQVITADQGYSGLGQVEVNVAVPAPVLDQTVITPTTSTQVIIPESPVVGFSKVTVSPVDSTIDSDITANNIRKDVDILGVTGTLVELLAQSKNYNITTNGTTAISPDMGFNAINGGSIVVDVQPALQNKTVSPQRTTFSVTADSPNYGLDTVTVTAAPLQSKTVNPSGSIQTITADSPNYGLDTVTVTAAPLQSKSVSPTGSTQMITPDSGYYGISSVEIAGAPLQSKSVSPTGSTQEIEADNEYYGLSKVTVGAVLLQNKTVTPSNLQQVITADSGYTGLASVTVEDVDYDDIYLALNQI